MNQFNIKDDGNLTRAYFYVYRQSFLFAARKFNSSQFELVGNVHKRIHIFAREEKELDTELIYGKNQGNQNSEENFLIFFLKSFKYHIATHNKEEK